jgi:nitrate reductase gamma subunit
MKALFSFIVVLLLVLVAYAGVAVANLHFLFGVIIPYAAVATFIIF